MSPRRHGKTRALVLAGALLISLAATGASATTPTCFGRDPTITGTDGPDTLNGTAGSDVILGLGGNDTISGAGGSDFICGGTGNDTLQGNLGRDRLSGEAGADSLIGDSGDDRLLGGPGNDRLDGSEGSDATTGGAGTDICLGTEAPASCEVFPPSGCSNPKRVPATPLATNVTVVGSNAFQTYSEYVTIEGEHYTLHLAAELRNDAGSSIRLGKAWFRIYDEHGALLAERWARPEADVLAPGQRTVVTETTPSHIYWDDEDNVFPHGWASWELQISATFGPPSEWDDVIIGSRLSSLLQPPGGGAEAQGTATNTRGVPLDSVSWWVVLYDAKGRLINVGTTFASLYGTPLAPGASTPFTITIYNEEATCFASARVGAAGS
jgi:Ca2+-binding RTX toxin-like protein